jgi:hypothetical protein
MARYFNKKVNALKLELSAQGRGVILCQDGYHENECAICLTFDQVDDLIADLIRAKTWHLENEIEKLRVENEAIKENAYQNQQVNGTHQQI